MIAALTTGAGIGVLGGLIGLGGAEFRLPLLICLFGFAALHAVILSKAMSLIVVTTALPARLFSLPYNDIAANLLAGSLIGAWLGASWATRIHSRTLGALLVLIAIVLATSHFAGGVSLELPPPVRIAAAVMAGIGIGIVAALMGVAGGELLIPTIVLVFAVDIKIAGRLSLLVSLPTMRESDQGRQLPWQSKGSVAYDRLGDGCPTMPAFAAASLVPIAVTVSPFANVAHPLSNSPRPNASMRAFASVARCS